MANRDFPRGFWPAYTRHGGPPSLRRYYTSGTAHIHRGDIVIASTASTNCVRTVSASTDFDASNVIGVSNTFTTSTAGSTGTRAEVYVYDDLDNTVFVAQTISNAGLAAGTSAFPLNECCLPNFTTGSSATGISAQEIATSSTSSVGPIMVLDKVDRPDNAWGANVDLYCRIVHTVTGGMGTAISS